MLLSLFFRIRDYARNTHPALRKAKLLRYACPSATGSGLSPCWITHDAGIFAGRRVLLCSLVLYIFPVLRPSEDLACSLHPPRRSVVTYLVWCNCFTEPQSCSSLDCGLMSTFCSGLDQHRHTCHARSASIAVCTHWRATSKSGERWVRRHLNTDAKVTCHSC